jgi:hypothetical protein
LLLALALMAPRARVDRRRKLGIGLRAFARASFFVATPRDCEA